MIGYSFACGGGIFRKGTKSAPKENRGVSRVSLKIEGYETELRMKVKEAGGKWKPEKRLWYVRYGKISGTTLGKHIYVDAMDK